MNREVLKDLDKSALHYRDALGLPLSAVVTFNVPVSYARMVRAEMFELGVEMDEPEAGCEMQLEFRKHGQVVLCVEDAV